MCQVYAILVLFIKQSFIILNVDFTDLLEKTFDFII